MALKPIHAEVCPEIAESSLIMIDVREWIEDISADRIRTERKISYFALPYENSFVKGLIRNSLFFNMCFLNRLGRDSDFLKFHLTLNFCICCNDLSHNRKTKRNIN